MVTQEAYDIHNDIRFAPMERFDVTALAAAGRRPGSTNRWRW